jgi:TRAP-type C4-dicarboxylate transport system permease large subunit
MGLSVWSLIAYIAAIIIWNAVLKRNIGEAMGIGWLVVILFGKSKMADLFLQSIAFSAGQETIFAALAFVFMAYVMGKTGLIMRMVNILNSSLGKVPGGAGYINTLTSALFGLMSGSGSGCSASVGAVTIPWMVNSRWPKQMAAIMTSGNAGLSSSLPPSSSMFILLGAAVVSTQVSTGALYLALLTGGAWTLVYRLFLVRYFVYKYDVQALPPDQIKPLSETMRSGWTSLLIFLGIIIPLGLTIGPVGNALSETKSFGPAALRSMSLIVWIPIFISWIAMIEGWKYLPKTFAGWHDFAKGAAPKYAVVGATLFFAFAAGDVMTSLGLGEDLTAILKSLNAPPLLMILLVGILITLVGGPLTSTATVASIGAVGFSALVGVGVVPATAAAVILIFASTEGASPPGAAPIYIACGIADVDPASTFVPLIIYYVLPIIAIGAMVALNILPTI